ncbi:hypothetical protein [Kitasatospora sp. GAS1066B]|uniref:hypothetical protein n=1 Tax=Kitasatospora sp. GAS1066B TaxID=3156271 RepID=UPI003518867E
MRQLLRGYRGYVELAAGLAEAAGKRVLGTAAELLERAGVDLETVERTVTTQVPPAVQRLETLVQEAVTVGRGGVDLAVGLARAEAEKAVERVGKLGDQVVKVGVVLAYLEGKLRGLEGEEAAGDGAAREQRETSTESTPRAGRAEGLFAADWEPEQEWSATQEDAGWATAAEPDVPPVVKRTPTPRKAAAKKSSAEQSPAKTSAATKKTATAKEPAAANKTTAKKTTAKKAAPAKKATPARKTTKKATPAPHPGDADA